MWYGMRKVHREQLTSPLTPCTVSGLKKVHQEWLPIDPSDTWCPMCLEVGLLKVFGHFGYGSFPRVLFLSALENVQRGLCIVSGFKLEAFLMLVF